MQGSNTTNTLTSDIQKNLGGGLVVDNKYGPKTTAAVQAFQTANGLKSDGIFGPITQAAYNKMYNTGTAGGSSVISTDPIHKEAATNSAALDKALAAYGATYTPDNTDTTPKDPNPPVKPEILNDTVSGTANDPIIQQLNALQVRSNDSTKMMIENIKATKARAANKLDAQYENYKSGLQVLGIQTNQAQVTPDLLMSHINKAETEHLEKLTELDQNESKALMDAENAKATNDFKTLNDSMTYLKQIRTEKAAALKSYNDSLTKDAAAATKTGDATAKVIAPEIYTTLQTLDAGDQEAFLVSIAQKFNIPLGSLATALVAQKAIADKAAAKSEDNKLLSPTEAATLGVPYGTTRGEAAKKGITPARYKPGSGKKVSSTQADKDEIKQGKNVLKTGTLPDGTKIGNPQGKDGYYDPGVYTELFSRWKGTPKEFISKYPIVGSVNPLSYTKLPDALQGLLPKAKGAAASQTP